MHISLQAHSSPSFVAIYKVSVSACTTLSSPTKLPHPDDSEPPTPSSLGIG